MKVVITGGGGFLGTEVCKMLVKQNHQVVSISRHVYPHLQNMGVRSLPIDLSQKNELEYALEGAEVVFHMAAIAKIWGKRKDFYQTNVIGTQNIIALCRKLGVSRLIYTSSPSVVFGNQDLCGVDESQNFPKRHYCDYAKTKSIAERLVLAANDGDKLCTVSLRPHLIWGPNDKHLIPRVIQGAKKKTLKIVGDGKNKVDVIFIENAATAHILAMEKLLPGSNLCGQSYFLGQEKPVILWDFINQILDRANISPIKKRVSPKVAYALGAAMEKTYSGLGLYKNDPPMTRFLAMQLSKSHYFSHAKAKRDLGDYIKVSLDEGLDRLGELSH